MLEPLLVVALGEVGAELRAARLLALDARATTIASAQSSMYPSSIAPSTSWLKTVPRSSIVGGLRLLLEPPDDLERGLQPVRVAEHGDVLVHRRAQLVLDLRDAAAVPLAADDRRRSRAASSSSARRRRRASPCRRRARGGVLAGAAAEDQRVEQRVRAEAVAAVDRDAGDLAGGVEAGDRRLAVDVGLDAAHDVVHARA